MNQLPRQTVTEPPLRASTATQAAVIVLAAVAFIWFLSWARPILLPIAAALLLGMILGPVADRGEQRGIPRAATNVAVLLVVGLFGYGIVALFVPTLSDWLARAPEFASELRQKIGFLERMIGRVNELEGLFGGAGALKVQVESDESKVAVLFAFVTPALAQSIVFIFTLILFMMGRNQIKNRLVLSLRGRENRLKALRIVSNVEQRLLDYFTVITLINAGVAFVTWLSLAALGVPNAMVWAFLAFIANYLPVVGPLILKLLLLGMGFVVMPTLATGLLPVLAYLAITTVESNFVTPRVFGKRLTIQPLWIFLSVCFLTWLWGPIGALLSTPILTIVLISAEHLAPADEVSLPG